MAFTDHTWVDGEHGNAANLNAWIRANFQELAKFSIGALLEGAPPANGLRMLWRAPFDCTVTNVRAHFDAGTSITVNARKNQASDFLASDFVHSTANAWGDGGAVQNTAITAGDDIEIELVATSGAVTKANVQVDFTRIV